MSEPIIDVEGVSKRYRLGQFNARSLREEIERAFRRSRSNGGVASDQTSVESEFWALKDVSFAVPRGEVLGIIGRNGAGKSTLLKILSRITEPTSGEIRVRGRVASLLEVGTGFHPELTGRENIYLNGAVLGMRRREIAAKFDEIVAFAEVEKFLDTPVKRYSSGMYVRLAFAVAAHLEPEILFVDEVLAVGDAEFQKKCLGKMKSVSAQEGRTVLFVSHNMTAIANLCHKALLLKDGKLVHSGDATSVIAQYLASGAAEEETRAVHWHDRNSAPGDDLIRVKRVEVAASDGGNGPLTTETPLSVIIEHWSLSDSANTIIEIIVRAVDGSIVFHSFSSESATPPSYGHVGLFRTECYIPGNLLNAGTFHLEAYLLHGSASNYFSVTPSCTFSLFDTGVRASLDYYGRFAGFVHPKLEWRAEPVHHDVALERREIKDRAVNT